MNMIAHCFSEPPAQVLSCVITNGTEDVAGRPDGIDESGGLAKPGRANFEIAALPRLYVGWDYLVQAFSKLGFPAVPLLGEPVVIGAASDPFRPRRAARHRGTDDVKYLGVDRVLSIAPDNQILVGIRHLVVFYSCSEGRADPGSFGPRSQYSGQRPAVTDAIGGDYRHVRNLSDDTHEEG